MSKVLWLILLLVAVVVLVPPVRERAKPHLAFALDPFYEWSAKNRVSEISNLVKRADALGRTIPAAADFPRFVDTEDTKQNASVDPWGTPYYLLAGRRSYQVGSAGKDREPGTTDDILSVEETLTRPAAGAGRR
ncbi:MAG TPA: type II secretion system protein GspG [Longimicrobiaceae bacterium]|nr:type II secretion system protein GspG [Longimicrobiaceae bacterium]